MLKKLNQMVCDVDKVKARMLLMKKQLEESIISVDSGNYENDERPTFSPLTLTHQHVTGSFGERGEGMEMKELD